jgi:hypothetical protein
LGEFVIKDKLLLVAPMIATKTSVLMAAMAMLGTVAPAAFAWDGDDNSYNEAYIKDVTQSNEKTFDIYQDQDAYATATTGDYSDGDATAAISQDQGFCIQDNQANQVSGRDSDSEQDNEISADADAEAEYYSAAEASASVDCS